MTTQQEIYKCENYFGGHLFKDTYKEPLQTKLIEQPDMPTRYEYLQHKYCKRCGFETMTKEK